MSSNHKQVIAQIDDDLVNAAVDALNATMALAINYVRSDSDTKVQPGARVRTSKNGVSYYDYHPRYGMRRAHPGGWADVTSQLVNAYGFEEPTVSNKGIVGSLYNTAPHADDLEGKPRKTRGTVEQYWVLDGLFQATGADLNSDFRVIDTFERKFSEALV